MDKLITIELPVWVALTLAFLVTVTVSLSCWLAKLREKLWHMGDKKLGGITRASGSDGE